MAPYRKSITLRASLSEIERLNRTWQEFEDNRLLPARTRWTVQLAVEEMVTNTIVHGLRDQPCGTIDLDIAVDTGSVRVSLTDAAPEFNPLLALPPQMPETLEEREQGGLGIHLVRKLMDRVEYQRVDGRNQVSMEKRF